ncbi:prephenate/arogenate dehydrogenase [Tumidithrix helvetica PCC 7403]|uniref:prephenate/arogenate dehydrogenase n=1 Tax=Tumidithrix helvetica TaxID=3457545 RepID=UPI003CA184A7
MNIGIIGLGLIGGSLGLDLLAQKQNHYVWGISRNQDTCKQAVLMGAVEAASQDPDMIPYLKQADLVVICTPIPAILPAIASISSRLSPQAIITDVGSVKSAIVAQASKQWGRFVGGHPMAGTAFQGISAAERNLFQQRPCVITPFANPVDSQGTQLENSQNNAIDREAVEIVRSLWQSVGAIVHECSPEVHDRAVAWISHLPVMVSASLIMACQQEGDAAIAELSQKLASSGFRDTSRVGGGNPELGRLMAEYNQPALLKSLRAYQSALQDLIDKVESGEWQGIENTLEITQSDRRPFVDGKG